MFKKSLTILFVAIIPVLIIANFFFVLSSQPVLAQQGGAIVVDKQLGRASNVVHVGEYITFTIRVENRSNFTVTTLPLTDTYNANVLAFVDATPSPTTVNTTTGQIDWNDLTTFFPDLVPGDVVTVVVGFIVEHPEPTVVNYAGAHDVESSGGPLQGSGDNSGGSESVGGSAPLEKRIADGVTPTVGLPITFNITITNDGYTTMTVVPLIEDYDPAFIEFSSAQPPPDFVDAVTGVLSWTDVTSWTGDIPAFGTIDVTVTFTALQSIANTMNQASVQGARDWYDNDLTAGADSVPIVIIGGPGPAATATPTATPSSGSTSPNPAPQATATVTATFTATAVLAEQFPDTGVPPESGSIWPTVLLAAFALVFPLAIWLLQRRFRT